MREPGRTDVAGLLEQALADRSKVRKIVSLLYSSDPETRFLAAKALGAIGDTKPDFIRPVWRRILNATDDTMSCWGVAEGLGEIGRAVPDLRGKILLRLKRFRKDESTCQGFLWAICRIGRVDREKIREFIPDVLCCLDSEEPGIVGQALWAAGELCVTEAAEAMTRYLSDARELWLYQHDRIARTTIGDIAGEALHKLRHDAAS